MYCHWVKQALIIIERIQKKHRKFNDQRFREHIKAALITSKPLIIHTRQAAEDTLLVNGRRKCTTNWWGDALFC